MFKCEDLGTRVWTPLQHIHMSSRQHNLYSAMHKLGSSPIGCVWGFQYPQTHPKWGIDIGSSPIGSEGFVQPRKGQGEARPLVLQ